MLSTSESIEWGLIEDLWTWSTVAWSNATGSNEANTPISGTNGMSEPPVQSHWYVMSIA